MSFSHGPVPARVAVLAITLFLWCASMSQASVAVGGTGEPAFTNTTTNTQWTQALPNSSWDYYRAHITYYVDGNVYSNAYLSLSTVQQWQEFYANWTGVINTLQEGHRYGMCVTPEYWWSAGTGNAWVPESQNSCGAGVIAGKLTNTVIDRTRPQVVPFVDGTATYTNNPTLQYHVNYTDNLSPPTGSFICVAKGTPGSVCTGPQYNYDAPCSGYQAVQGGYAMDCSQNVGGAGDGTWNFCLIATDSAIPDNPNGTNSDNQFTTIDRANQSLPNCGYVTLDRVAPTVTPTASATTVTVGDLVTFTAAGSDASSGLNNQWAWTWGDNTAGGSGQTATHTFTQAGTFIVSLATADNAGNAGTGTKTITVNPAPAPPPSGGGTPPGGSTTGGSTTGGSTTGGSTTGGSTTGSSTTGSSSGGSVTGAPSAVDISKSAGGGGTQSTAVGKLGVLAPRSITLSAKRRTLPLALTAQSAGRATFALIRSGKIVGRGTLEITTPGTVGFRLKLPKNLKPGRYVLQVTFLPSGQTRGVTRTLRLTVKAARTKARAASRPRIVHAGAPRASAGGGS